MAVEQPKMADSQLLRIGGILSLSWLLWAANSTWFIAGGFVHPLGATLSVFLYGLFFVLGFVTLRATLPSGYTSYVVGTMALALILRTFVLTSVLRPGIETDGLAISLSAANDVLGGRNPYVTDHAAAFGQYHLSPEFNTPKIDGTVVTEVTYPALSFLLYAAPEALNIDPRWVSVSAFIVTIILLTMIAPSGLRTLAPLVVFIDPNFINYVLGLQDMTYVPLMMLAAYFWTEAPVIAGVLLGLAAAIKQEPWLAVPFFAIGVLASTDGDARARFRRAAIALAAVAVAFFIPNMPFIVANPAAWFHGVMDPFAGKNVEWGSGLVALALSGSVHIDRWMLTALGAIAYLAMIVAAIRGWPRIRDALWLAPGFSLFFAPRSLENYYMFLIPVCLASWLGQTENARAFKTRFIERLSGVPFARILAASATAIVLFGCSSPQVAVKVTSIGDSRHAGLIDTLSLVVSNGAAAPLALKYLVIVDGRQQYRWNCLSGCDPLEPGRARMVVIRAPDYAAAVPPESGVAAVAVDSTTGSEFESDFAATPSLNTPNGAHLPNACLCVTADLGYVVPAGWEVNQADVATGVVRYASSGDRGSVTMTLTPGPLRSWKYQTISRSFVPFDHPVAAALTKGLPYSGGTSPSSYAGISIDDGDGHSLLFTWGKVARTVAYQGQSGVVVVEPESSQKDLIIAFQPFASAAHLESKPVYTISFVIAAMEPAPPMTATFSGVRVSDPENMIASPIRRSSGG